MRFPSRVCDSLPDSLPDAVWEEGDFDGDGVVQFSDFVILANNFGNSRPPLAGPKSPAANISAADNVFERFERFEFDDELDLNKILKVGRQSTQ